MNDVTKLPLKSIQTLWTDYQKLCVPENAGVNQVLQTRQAFFGGFVTTYLLFEAMLLSEKITDERLAEILKYYKMQVEDSVKRAMENRHV